MASELALLMRERLRVRGSGLEARVASAGRLLPARVRRAALEIAEAEKREANPRLARQNDPAALARAYAEVERHLKAVNPSERRKDAVLGFLGSVALGLLALFAAVLVLLVWRDLI
jgi:hypothetical protein